MLECSICGGTQFSSREILWEELIAAWGLSREEVDYINRQQGCACTSCRASLRIVALGQAVRDALGAEGPMTAWAADSRFAGLRVLDINGATAFSNALSKLPGYVRGNYPEVNMEALPYPAAAFDLVVHSDTLEHVPHPLRGLEECRRVLRAGGHLCFTIPIIVGRLTRSRDGLPPSWHGNSSQNSDDYLVQTEYGADMWTQVMRAGFTRVTLHQVSFPAAIAITARNPPARN